MASIRKRPSRPKPWEAVYRDPTGRQRTRSFARKIDAQRFLTTVEADMLRGSYVDPTAGRITFRELAEQWAAGQVVDVSTRDGAASRLRAHLIPTFGDMEVRAIQPSTVQQWLAGASRELAPSYVRLLLTTLSTILTAAVEDGLIVRNPCRSRAVQAPRVPPGRVVPWTVEQVQLAVAALPRRYSATAVLAAGCGLRQGEAFGIRVKDVDFLGRLVEVRQQVKHVRGQGVVIAPPKGGKTRTVPFAGCRRYGALRASERVPDGARGSRVHERRRPAAQPRQLQQPGVEARGHRGRARADPGERFSRSPPPLRELSPRWRSHDPSPRPSSSATRIPGSRCGSTPTSCPPARTAPATRSMLPSQTSLTSTTLRPARGASDVRIISVNLASSSLAAALGGRGR